MSPHALPDRRQLAEGLDAVGADAWLLFDFHGLNPVAGRVLGLGGMGSRRLFVLLPRDGEPVAVAHKIETAAAGGISRPDHPLRAVGGTARGARAPS